MMRSYKSLSIHISVWNVQIDSNEICASPVICENWWIDVLQNVVKKKLAIFHKKDALFQA